MNTVTTERPTITMIAVTSSQIAAIGHCAQTKTLAIHFAGKGDVPGSLYHYANFHAEQFAALWGAESVGKHFYKHIKPFAEKHPYQKIDTTPLAVADAPGAVEVA